MICIYDTYDYLPTKQVKIILFETCKLTSLGKWACWNLLQLGEKQLGKYKYLDRNDIYSDIKIIGTNQMSRNIAQTFSL